MPIRLHVLGGLQAFSDDVPLAWVPGQRIRSALLVYLALEHEATRERLAHVFWPDEELDHARHVLSQTLYLLRQALGEGCIEHQGEVVRFGAPVVCDAAEFEAAVERGNFAGASTLYGGAFLADVSLCASRDFEAWVDRERAKYGRLHRRACRGRIETLVGEHKISEAIEAARAWVALGPFDDEAQHRLIELLAMSGQRSEALAQYELYEKLLVSEGLEPLDETKALVGQLRAGEVGNGAILPASLPRREVTSQAILAPSGGVTPRDTQPVRVGLRRLGKRWPLAAAVLIVASALLAAGRWLLPRSEAPQHARTSIAVLPFKSLGADGPYDYFAGGLHDELLTQLAKVAALSVRGRTSVTGYAETVKPMRTIADELSVGAIVEGSVLVVGERLRVNVQLIDASTDEHLWAERYDRNLDDAFAVQSDIARRIVAAVGATLGATERTAISASPTDDPEAYRLYLQGRYYWLRPGYVRRNVEIAQDFFEQAVALDSTFALAFAALSEAHGRMSWFRWDLSPERLTRQQEAAERALRLAPDLPQAHLAMGLVHYNGRRDWRAALRELQVALQALPNDPELWLRIGSTHRRLGNWDQALAALDKVVALDPRNVDALNDLGGTTNRLLHRYPDAIQWYSRGLALAPDNFRADLRRAIGWVLWRGHIDSLGAALARHPDADLNEWRWSYSLWAREPDSILALLRRTQLRAIEAQDFYLPTSLYAAWAHRLRGDLTAAGLAFDSALVLLDSVVAVFPNDWRLHAARGLALAGLRRDREAQREARWLQQSSIYRDDPIGGVNTAENRAMILSACGQTDAALQEIERLLAGPSVLSVHTLRLDPRWDPIRDDLRFRALLVKYAEPHPVR